MSIKNKCIYECKCEKCGKEETLNRAPLMVTTFSEEPQYLCESCLKNLISNYYGENNKKESEIKERKSFFIKVSEPNEGRVLDILFPIELSKFKSRILESIMPLVRAYIREGGLRGIDKDETISEVSITIDDIPSFKRRICLLEQYEVLSFTVAINITTRGIAKRYYKLCTIERLS